MGSTKEVSEVHLASADQVEKKIQQCSAAAQSGTLLVIADFDRTLTRCFTPDGKRGTSAHGVLEQASVLSEEFQRRATELFDKYFPIEIDSNMSIPEKIPLMNEWYTSVHELVIKENVSRENIAAAVSSCETIVLRDGVVDLLRKCQEASPPIPVAIMSAGLGDVIEEFLRQRLPFPLAETTTVVSNKMIFDDDGKLVGFSEPLLHMFNKTGAIIDKRWTEDKKSCLLLGDGMGDVTMANTLGLEELRVGFLNEKVEEKLAQFVDPDSFDVVVTHDGPLPDVCYRAIGSAPDSSNGVIS